ncbi:MAG: twin-arginine translocase subunit TatC [Chloroflexi bacterium]|nr:twin-arginine translocase subunit TatC [Chloroflexota bacterium]
MSNVQDGAQMTLLEHLQELRSRIVKMMIALVVTTGGSFFFATQIFEVLKRAGPSDLHLTYIEVTEMFTSYFKVSLMMGIALSLPVIIYQMVRFVAPGLTSSEKRYFYALLPAVFVFFGLGAAFSYFLLVPFAVRYLLTFSNIAEPQIRVSNYVGFVATLIFWVGAAFETPLLIWFFCKIKLVTPKRLAGLRRYAVVLAFVVGAVITPTPDPVNQTIVSVPIYLLFELGILLARIFK